MKYVMVIYQGDAQERQAALPEEEQKQVYADYQGINEMPGVTPVPPMGLPENATTVRVEGGKTLTRVWQAARAHLPPATRGRTRCAPTAAPSNPRLPTARRNSMPCTPSSPTPSSNSSPARTGAASGL